MEDCKPVATPFEPGTKFEKLLDEEDVVELKKIPICNWLTDICINWDETRHSGVSGSIESTHVKAREATLDRSLTLRRDEYRWNDSPWLCRYWMRRRSNNSKVDFGLCIPDWQFHYFLEIETPVHCCSFIKLQYWSCSTPEMTADILTKDFPEQVLKRLEI